jgi:DNA-binding response OmpR family regulator
MRVGPLEVDPLSRGVWLHGKPLHLSKKEFALLRALAAKPTGVFTREESTHQTPAADAGPRRPRVCVSVRNRIVG